MPVQATARGYVFFPDGAQVSIKAAGDSVYFDVGCISTAVNAVYNYDENQVETANCGKTAKQIKNMTIAGDFTLIDLDPEGVEKLSGGAMELVTTTASATTTVDDQVIASGDWADKTPVAMSMIDSDVSLKASAEPTLTSVTGSVDGALVADDDYTLIADDSPSGFSIVLNLAKTALTTLVQSITVDYGSVTPVASEILYGGSSTEVLSAYAMKITHTDDNSKIRQLELFSVDPNSGGFAFNFKGANEEGVEEMPLSYTAKLDTSRTTKRQLFAWTVEAGAE